MAVCFLLSIFSARNLDSAPEFVLMKATLNVLSLLTGSLGIACGAGFYECVITAMVLIVFTMEFMQPMELAFKRRLRNITIYVEFEDAGDVDTITETLRRQGARLFDLEMERTERQDDKLPSAIMTLKLGKENASHSAILSSVAELSCVNAIQELIA